MCISNTSVLLQLQENHRSTSHAAAACGSLPHSLTREEEAHVHHGQHEQLRPATPPPTRKAAISLTPLDSGQGWHRAGPCTHLCPSIFCITSAICSSISHREKAALTAYLPTGAYG